MLERKEGARGVVTYDQFRDAVRLDFEGRNLKVKYALRHGVQCPSDLTEQQQFAVWNRLRDKYLSEAVENARKWKCLFYDRDRKMFMVNLKTYAARYCEMDVRILALGWMKFRELVFEGIGEGVDINETVSVTQCAHNYLKDVGVFEGCYWMSGIPRYFIQQCVEGGKTMPAHCKKQLWDNKEWRKNEGKRIHDFDACSLYPAAMVALGGFLKGKPKVIDVKKYRHRVNPNWDGYFVRVNIDRVSGTSRRAFPCVSYVDKRGRHFTDDIELLKGKPVFMCRFNLEDAVKYHGIEYTILEGYYYNEGRNEKIKEVMTQLYMKRKKFKREKNNVQLVFKMIMNSSYGRTILNPPKKTDVFLPRGDDEKAIALNDDADTVNFIHKNYYRILSFHGLPKNSRWKTRFTVLKDVNEHYSHPAIGVEILAMSKRIMNEVMMLAEDHGVKIAYMDTDSMHIRENDLRRVQALYREEYKRELIGGALGQFHTDFEMEEFFDRGIRREFGEIFKVKKVEEKKKVEGTSEVFSIHLNAVGKKAYCDELIDPSKVLWPSKEPYRAYHFRLKGISELAVYDYCLRYNITVKELFRQLRAGRRIKFNLLAGARVSFDTNKNFTVTSKREFHRNVQFNMPIIRS